ncbi:MAG: hypothetical protein ACRELC_02755 [Gemmatimonadota bacterium]
MNSENPPSGMSDCDRVRELLWPLDAPRAWVEGEEGARAHLEACPECQAFFERDAVIGRILRGERVLQPAPRELRERVFDALARERAMGTGARPDARPRAVWTGRRAAGAAAVAAVVALGLFLLPRAGDSGSAFARDYLSRVVEQRRVDVADSVEISDFFLHEFGQRIEPRRVAAAEMARAMICLIEGRRAATVEYVLGGHTVAHYRIPLAAGAGRRIVGVQTEADGGVRAVRWSDDRFEHALVSDLPASELERIARTRFAAH